MSTLAAVKPQPAGLAPPAALPKENVSQLQFVRPQPAARLTKKERELLNMLMQNPGRCISRDTLLKTIWQYADGARTRTVDVHVQRLRRKLGREAAAIKTIVRLGYCWFPDPEAINGVSAA
jgi:DNA-binding response OmpR family regulator